MDSLAVIKKFNVLEHLVLRLLLRFELGAIDKLFLEYAMKGFDAGIIIAISLTAHARLHVIFFQTFTVIGRGVL
ncbi:hypothetical protein D3C86_1854940 [compost metagenome]